jgi:pyruvate/2-oxoglutarate dehydrogenase complex dihydrolipoamide acyltransferase (E2) component
VQINVPRLGFSMTEGTLIEWMVPDGGQAVAGEVLYILESEKVENEVAAPVTGTLRHLAAPGDTLEVGAPLGEIEPA